MVARSVARVEGGRERERGPNSSDVGVLGERGSGDIVEYKLAWWVDWRRTVVDVASVA